MKKGLKLIVVALLLLQLTGCGKDKNQKPTETITKLYDMIEAYYIPNLNSEFESYENSNFYMDTIVKFEDLSDESRLYYAYKTIVNVSPIQINSCNELSGYIYNGADLSTLCNNNNDIISKEQTGKEWFFYDITKKSLEEAYHNMYGSNKEMPLKNFTISVSGICVYSKVNDNYLCFVTPGKSDFDSDYAEAKYDHYIENEDSIEIFDRYIWVEKQNENETYFKSRFKRNENLDNKDFSKGALYKHTFKRNENNNYYWYSSERVE